MICLARRAALLKRFGPLVMQWAGAVYSVGVSLGLSILFARTMGVSAFGQYAYIYVLATFLMLFQDAGFNTLLMRERAAASTALLPYQAQLPAVALLHLFVSTCAFMVITAVLHEWLDAASLVSGIFCFATITLTRWQSSWLKGAGQFQRDALYVFLGRSVSAILVLVSVWIFGATPTSIFLAWGLGLLLTLLYLRENWPSPLSVCWRIPFWAYRNSISFLFVGVVSTIYQQVDIVLLRNMLGEVPDLGHYAVAMRMHDGVLLLAMPVVFMLFRHMRILAMSGEGDQGFSSKAVLGAFTVGLLLAGGGWGFGPRIIGAFFGDHYAEGTHSVVGLLFTALIFALPNYVLTQNAIANQQERWLVICMVLSIAVNVAVNLYLIPLKGIEGAAWAAVWTEIALSLTLGWGLRHSLLLKINID